jgi:hypothetical protein
MVIQVIDDKVRFHAWFKVDVCIPIVRWSVCRSRILILFWILLCANIANPPLWCFAVVSVHLSHLGIPFVFFKE